MNKSDKKILAFYVCLGISLISVFSYFDSLYERPHIDNFLPTDPIKRLSFEHIISTGLQHAIDQEKWHGLKIPLVPCLAGDRIETDAECATAQRVPETGIDVCRY